MDIERIVVRMTADATQYLQMFDMVEARLVAFGAFMAQELLKNSLQLAMDFERMGLAFEVMTGSAEKGKKVLSDIVDLAMRTPFTTQELIKAGKQAMAFGIEDQDVIPVLERLGAVSVATGADMDRLILAFGQVRTVGRLMGQELRQFTNAGVPMLQYLARAMKVAEAEVPQLVRMGRVGFNDVAEAINLMTNEGGKFFGLLERTNLETLFGRWQNFTEGVQKTARKFGEAMVEAFDLKGLVGGWAAALNTINFDRLIGMMQTVRDVLVGVYNVLASVIDSVAAWADRNPELAAVAKTLLALGAAAYVLSTAFGVLEFAVGAVILFFTPLATMVTFLVTSLWGLVAAMAAVVGWPLLIVAGFIALVGVILMVAGDLDGLKGILIGVGKAFGELAAGVGGFVVDGFVGALEQAGRSLMRLYDLFGGLKDVFGESIGGMVAAFGSGEMELGMKLFVETAKLGFKTLWEWVKLEWDLVWVELGISLEFGLKKAFFNAVRWLAVQVENVLKNLPGMERSSAARVAGFNAGHAQTVAGLEAEQARRMADAAGVARQRLDELINTIRDTPDVAELRRGAADARFLSAVRGDVADFHKEFVKTALDAWRDGNQEAMLRLARAPDSALAGVVGPGVVQAQFQRLLETALESGLRLEESFQLFEQGRIDKAAFDAAKKAAQDAQAAFRQFHDTLTGVAGAARVAAENIGKVFETSAATRAYMLDLGKEFDKGTTALEKFTVSMSKLEEAAAGAWRTLDRRAAAMAGIGAAGIVGNRGMTPITTVGSDIETFGLYREYKNLRQAIGAGQERRAPAALEGSREAAEIIGRSSQAQLSVEQQIHADLILANEINRQQRDYMAEVARVMRQRRDAGLPIPVPAALPE